MFAPSVVGSIRAVTAALIAFLPLPPADGTPVSDG